MTWWKPCLQCIKTSAALLPACSQLGASGVVASMRNQSLSVYPKAAPNSCDLLLSKTLRPGFNFAGAKLTGWRFNFRSNLDVYQILHARQAWRFWKQPEPMTVTQTTLQRFCCRHHLPVRFTTTLCKSWLGCFSTLWNRHIQIRIRRAVLSGDYACFMFRKGAYV